MLDKQDMIDLIKAEEAFRRLNARISYITGGSEIDNKEFNGMYKLYDVIRRNSCFSKDDDYDEEMFLAIIKDRDKTSEKKYEMLKKKGD